VVRVQDEGIGIVPEMLDRIFDLFVQADASPSRAQGGLGIGLTLVRRLLGLHQGSVTAKSGGLGQGSEFTIRFPAATAVELAPTARTSEHSMRHPPRTPDAGFASSTTT
jgi:signal transduction histidine kinase